MKNSVLIFYLLVFTSFNYVPEKDPVIVTPDSASENLFIIIIDGFRWKEVFNGADPVLINNTNFTPDTATIKSLYWAGTGKERRRMLMPFFWNVIAEKGQLLGNRELKNKVNVSNIYSISYPGYSEIFTGTTDITISGNHRKPNKKFNVLEYLNSKDEFKEQIAVFSSWDVFPYILNEKRNGIMMNSGYDQIGNDIGNQTINMINLVQEQGIENKGASRYDLLTYTTAKEYIRINKPRIIVLGLGETDDFAHQKRYDLYLQQANQADRMIAELWNMVQTTPGYKNKTSFLITTDHGRGNNEKHWSGHGTFIRGSSQSWIAMMGPNIEPLGERDNKQQVHSKQLAESIAHLVGEEYSQQLASVTLSKK